MAYYFAKTVDMPFDAAIEAVTAALAERGFGVLTTIDVQATMKKKIDADMPPYTILGACNPGFAFEALQAEDKIGTMLPCNVIVRATEDGKVEVAAVDPVASMQAVGSSALGKIAGEVQQRLKDTVDSL
ncbi:DUF302 domain-containing protein [Bauldia litoralis]|uniref:Uncharacterized conserved protein, DUF302 family n=1 Tax=Bauldia litoralis TaxID=665467 RepID=A0A1G6DUF6_9HYPH|nr:DUF302 domain-containing protein [Bauldia litoralis]SDB48804.1 Uncharacterized conserved protein, DUF302 family [Bauldia litoralis]